MLQQERYIRQIQLPKFGLEGQEKLTEAKVLVIGAGGLGLPVLQYLVGMGIGTIGLVDGDKVQMSNLHRQVLYTEEDIDKNKVDCCIEKLQKQNPNIILKGFSTFLNPLNALQIIRGYDVVVDATDNFSARYLINDACVILKKPFVYGAIQHFEGHVSVFNHKNGPTYRCLYPNQPSSEQIPDCNTAGVLGIVPGLVGSFQALEVIKVISGMGKPLSGTLQVFDFLDNSQYQVKLQLKPENLNINALRTTYEAAQCHISETITADELLEWYQEQKDFFLLDVRETHEFKKGHLKRAISYPLSQLGLRQPPIAEDRPWVVLCQMGGRSQKAIEHLKAKKPKLKLRNLEGGLSTWQRIHGDNYLEKT